MRRPEPGSDDRTLVFVHNVDGTPLAPLRDLYRGVTTGETDCRLCDLTFGHLIKDRSWREFIVDLPIDVAVVLRSTFMRRYPSMQGHPCPAGFITVNDTAPLEVVSRHDIDTVSDLDELRELVWRTVERIT